MDWAAFTLQAGLIYEMSILVGCADCLMSCTVWAHLLVFPEVTWPAIAFGSPGAVVSSGHGLLFRI